MQNFEAHNDKIRTEMLDDIGLSNLDELFAQIPDEVKIESLNLPSSLSQLQTEEEIKLLSKKNNTDFISFVGGGSYKRFIPACVSEISKRFEFNTAYTPYQAEISQGTLQVIYEYQSMICNLTNMDTANATMYDGATACAEAILMAVRINGKNSALISKDINPEYLKVIQTYCEAADIQIELFKNIPDSLENYACILVQYPDFYGEIVSPPIMNTDSKTLLICCADIVSLALLEPPKCDIMVGEIQSLGSTMSFGGPSAGYFACTDKYKRQMPGRIVGQTVDADGKMAFCLTLQTREQHIRREKATSNICSNQGLIALQSTVYLTVMGKEGLKQAAYLSAKNAHLLAEKLKTKGIKVLSKNFFNEFVIEVNDADEFLKKLKTNNILGGLKINNNKILVCATELNTSSQIEKYTKTI